MTNTHPSLQYSKILHPTFSGGYVLSCQEYTGLDGAFFFKLGHYRVFTDFQHSTYIANTGTVQGEFSYLLFYALFPRIIAIIQLKTFVARIAPPALSAIFTVTVLH
jgi:hypothetical protein